MSEWVRCPEVEDQEQEEVWTNESYGTIIRTNGKYIALIPQTFVLGPFEKLDEVQRKVLFNYDVITKLAQSFDERMLNHIENLRSEENFKKELK